MRADGTRAAAFLRSASSASWSPAGTHIAFIRGGDPWVARRDGSGAKRVTDLPSAQLSLAWSPDGRWLVTAPVDRGDLLLVRADGSATLALTHQDGSFHSWPSWQRR
jgi:Tol biopolymer transport system component